MPLPANAVISVIAVTDLPFQEVIPSRDRAHIVTDSFIWKHNVVDELDEFDELVSIDRLDMVCYLCKSRGPKGESHPGSERGKTNGIHGD